MKKLLLATNFSVHADHAATYAYHLAKQIKANLILCNADIVPAEVPQSGMVTWPLDESELLLKDSADELAELKESLISQDTSHGFKPAISCVDEEGTVTYVVNQVADKEQVELIVIGTHSVSVMGQFFFGDHSRKMIDAATLPLLLVPDTAKIAPINKIAFATDFKNIEDDLAGVYALIPIARLLNAKILITHIYNEKDHSPRFESFVKDFLNDLSNKADYPNIYYRVVQNTRTQAGLDWLCEHGQIDMLAMVHRPHGFFDELLNGSYTKKMAGSVSVPLLVFQATN